jgi:hypothetical protein
MRFAYVGQTNGRLGTFGRAFEHLQVKGTLRINCINKLGEDIEEAGDLTLCSFSLPQETLFLNIESSFREAVEYLVQIGLYEKRERLVPVFRLISNVRTNERVIDYRVNLIAKNILEKFVSMYENDC